ncbi:MAG: prepilin-type N-terminal cleavage/methylation domain-containing protein, partial [Planctomycetota bacterium]
MRHSRCGLTLLEMLLVLAIIVIVGALALPRLTGSVRRQELTNAAIEVRGALTKARNLAMREGEPALLLYQPESRVYAIALGSADAQSLAAFQQTQAMLIQMATMTEDTLNANVGDTGATGNCGCEKLPQDVTFHMQGVTSAIGAGQGIGGSGTNQIQSQGNGAGGGNGGANPLTAASIFSPSQMAQVPSMVFYPDGSADEGVVMLKD